MDFAGAVETVAVDDLTEEDDFADAAGGEGGGFGEDVGGGAREFAAAAVGDDAVGAGVGAAEDDGQVRNDGAVGKGVREGRRQVVSGGFGGEGGAAGLEIVAQGGEVGRRQEEIDEREAFAQAREFAGILADEAAHEGDDEAGVLLLEFGDVGQARVDLVLGLLADDAGVEQEEGGFAGVGDGAVADRFQQGGGAQGVGLVHLAADGPEIVGRGSQGAAAGRERGKPGP